MITKITGVLTRVLDEEVRVQVGPLEYQVLVPEFIRRRVQTQVGNEVTLHTSHFFDGNPMQGRVEPRLLGFVHEADLEFFDLFCTVDKIGVNKALKAMCRPVKEIADAISRQDARWLTTLPGVGAATAEQIVTTLKRKVTKFAVAAPASGLRQRAGDDNGPADAGRSPDESPINGQVIEDVYLALMSVGHSPIEARVKVDQLVQSGRPVKDVGSALALIYGKG
jgi:Holliday junction DNA helicase RuvA